MNMQTLKKKKIYVRGYGKQIELLTKALVSLQKLKDMFTQNEKEMNDIPEAYSDAKEKVEDEDEETKSEGEDGMRAALNNMKQTNKNLTAFQKKFPKEVTKLAAAVKKAKDYQQKKNTNPKCVGGCTVEEHEVCDEKGKGSGKGCEQGKQEFEERITECDVFITNSPALLEKVKKAVLLQNVNGDLVRE